MNYCEPCRILRNLPKTLDNNYGKCQYCHKFAIRYFCPPGLLPKPILNTIDLSAVNITK